MKKSQKILVGCLAAPFLLIGLIVVITILYYTITSGKSNDHIDKASIVLYVDEDQKPYDGDLEYIAIIDENTVYIKYDGKESLTAVKSSSDVHDGKMGILFKDGSLIVLSSEYILGYSKNGNTELYRLNEEKSKL